MMLNNGFELAMHYAIQLRNFWICLVGLASITVAVWLFDPIGDLYVRITLTLLATVVPFLFLMDALVRAGDRPEFSWPVVWFSAFSIAVLLILLGDSFNAPGLVIFVFSILAAIPAIWLYWTFTKGEHLLQLWLLPLLATASLYLVPPTSSEVVTYGLLFLPIPLLSYACIVWALITRSIIRARRKHDCAIWGPGLESLAMLFLVAPLAALILLAVNALGVDDIWLVVSGAIVGITFGGTVSQPFGQFMRDLGRLLLSYACIVWALITRSIIRARRKHDCAIWGPGLESLAMLFLVAPLAALILLAVNALGVDDIWLVVSGAIVGITFGGTVSQPFGQFMRDLGRL